MQYIAIYRTQNGLYADNKHWNKMLYAGALDVISGALYVTQQPDGDEDDQSTISCSRGLIRYLRIGCLRSNRISNRIKRDVRNYRFLIPVLKHIKQYRRMITHRASESVYCATKHR